MLYGITQCYLTLGRGDIPAFTPAEAGTRFSNSGGMQGWVDLVGWLEKIVYPYNGHPSWTTRARCWSTSLMRSTTLTTTPMMSRLCSYVEIQSEVLLVYLILKTSQAYCSFVRLTCSPNLKFTQLSCTLATLAHYSMLTFSSIGYLRLPA